MLVLVLVRTRKSCTLTTVSELHLCFEESAVVVWNKCACNCTKCRCGFTFTFHTICFPCIQVLCSNNFTSCRNNLGSSKLGFCAQHALHAWLERPVRVSNSASHVLFRLWHSFQVCIGSYSRSMPLSSGRRIVWSTALSRERAPTLCQLLHHLLQGGPAKRREKPIWSPQRAAGWAPGQLGSQRSATPFITLFHSAHLEQRVAVIAHRVQQRIQLPMGLTCYPAPSNDGS